MNKYIQKIAEAQAAGSRLCPRCGRFAMKLPISTNALSRVADGCYVCDKCGMAEAVQDAFGKPTPLDRWALVEMWMELE